jgi:hypothetical protein
MFRFPYRWLPRTIWPNLRSGYYDIAGGVRNLWRWLPIVWFDQDFDWSFLALIMEQKLRWMARKEVFHNHSDAARQIGQMLLCAELLKRIQERDYSYWGNAVQIFGKTSLAAQHAAEMERFDLQELGRILGKHMTSWWD